jgi:hypothetical protein
LFWNWSSDIWEKVNVIIWHLTSWWGRKNPGDVCPVLLRLWSRCSEVAVCAEFNVCLVYRCKSWCLDQEGWYLSAHSCSRLLGEHFCCSYELRGSLPAGGPRHHGSRAMQCDSLETVSTMPLDVSAVHSGPSDRDHTTKKHSQVITGSLCSLPGKAFLCIHCIVSEIINTHLLGNKCSLSHQQCLVHKGHQEAWLEWCIRTKVKGFIRR